MDPAIVYVYNPHAEAQVIPILFRASEEYAIAKIAARIFGQICQRITTTGRRTQRGAQSVTLSAYSRSI